MLRPHTPEHTDTAAGTLALIGLIEVTGYAGGHDLSPNGLFKTNLKFQSARTITI